MARLTRLKNKPRRVKEPLHHYRYSVLDENSLEEKFHMRMTKPAFITLTITILLIFAVLVVSICFYTPFKRLSPEYADIDLRKSLIQETLRVDSLEQITSMQRKQLEIIKVVIAGEIKADSLNSEESLKIVAENFISKKDKEKSFCEEYEDKERYNLSSIEVKKEEDAPVFFRPARGVVKRSFDKSNHHLGCDILASSNEPVLAAFEGIVIISEHTTYENWIITIMHSNGYMTIYKGLAQSLRKVGDTVKTGEAIGTVSTPEEGGKPYIHFELWKNGKALDPADYISF